MPRLNQIIAVEKGVKARSHQRLTEAHHALQKPALLSGISRTYRSKDEEGEQLPPEATRVQVKAEDIIRSTVDILSELFDVTGLRGGVAQRGRGSAGPFNGLKLSLQARAFAADHPIEREEEA